MGDTESEGVREGVEEILVAPLSVAEREGMVEGEGKGEGVIMGESLLATDRVGLTDTMGERDNPPDFDPVGEVLGGMDTVKVSEARAVGGLEGDTLPGVPLPALDPEAVGVSVPDTVLLEVGVGGAEKVLLSMDSLGEREKEGENEPERDTRGVMEKEGEGESFDPEGRGEGVSDRDMVLE